MSGYNIQALKKCVYELGAYISQCLKPDRLEGFDLKNE